MQTRRLFTATSAAAALFARVPTLSATTTATSSSTNNLAFLLPTALTTNPRQTILPAFHSPSPTHHLHHHKSYYTTTTTTTSINMSSSSSSSAAPPPDYATRKATFDMADAATLAEQLKDPATVLLDVRTYAEIAATGKFTKEEEGDPSLQYHHVSCTPTDATNLTMQAGTLFATKETPIIVYCMSGRRAHTARQALQQLGYTNVFNAGGLADIQDMKL